MKKSPKSLFLAPVLGILLLGILLFLNGCKIMKSDELQELEDAVSVIQLKAGQEVNRTVREKDDGFTGPVYAQINVKYKPIDNHTRSDVFEEIKANLARNNWKRDDQGIVPNFFSASLKKDSATMTVHVQIDSDDDLVSVQMTNLAF